MKYIQPHDILWAVITFITFATSQNIRNVDTNPNSKEFQGFELDNTIATSLIQKEVIRVSGVITDPQFYVGDQAKSFILEVNFTLKGNTNINFTCRDVYPLEKLKFDMSCTLKKVGEFFVSLTATPSNIEQFKLKNLTKKYTHTSNIVRKIFTFQNFSFPTTVSKPAPKPKGFELNFIDNNIQLKWTSQASLTNVTFFQINNKTNQLVKKEFLLSGNHQIFYPDFFEFRFFYPGNTSVEISHASSEDGTLSKMSSPFTKEKLSLTFKALRHLKQANSPIRYSVTPALPNMLRVAQRYNFTITFKVRAKTMYFMMSLDYKITRRVKFFRPKPDEEDEVKENVPVTVEIVFDKPGTYLLAFQAADRKIILNQPIYVGEGTPFLPDYFDYYEYFDQNFFDSMLEIEQQYIARYLTDGKIYKDPGFNASIEQQRAYLFELLNYERRKYKATPMTRDQTLEKMAQEHCQDMLENSYISVKNKQGEMPINRAIRYNLTSFVRQYIMASYSLGGLHLDTQINGPMVDITANKMLTRVGIGIVINKTHYPPYYIVTYDFSIRDLILSPPDPLELQKFRLQIINVTLEKNPNIRIENKDLSADIRTWIKQNTQYINEDLESFLEKKWGHKNKVKVWSIEVFFYEEELENIRDGQDFDNKIGTQIGLGLVVNKDSKSTMSAFFVFL